MSIALQTKVNEQEHRIQELERLIKSNTLQKEIDLLKSRLETLEQRQQRGRPPKEQNG